MGSYDCGSMNWMNSGLFINSPKFLERSWAEICRSGT